MMNISQDSPHCNEHKITEGQQFHSKTEQFYALNIYSQNMRREHIQLIQIKSSS